MHTAAIRTIVPRQASFRQAGHRETDCFPITISAQKDTSYPREITLVKDVGFHLAIEHGIRTSQRIPPKNSRYFF